MKLLLVPFIFVAAVVAAAGGVVLGSSGNLAVKLSAAGDWALGKKLGGPNGKTWDK